jgi:hypothetical protein
MADRRAVCCTTCQSHAETLRRGARGSWNELWVTLRPNIELENRAPSRLRLTRKLPEASGPQSVSLPLDDLYVLGEAKIAAA